MPIGALAGGLGLLGSLAGVPAARRARRETEGRFNQALGLQQQQQRASAMNRGLSNTTAGRRRVRTV